MLIGVIFINKKLKGNKIMKKKFKDMIFVKGGKYKPCFTDDEKEIYDLEVCRYLTTQKMWLEVMDCNLSKFEGPYKPVDSVTWWEALEFCNKLSEKYNLEPVYDLSKKGTLLINQLDGEKISPDIADFKKTEGFRLPTEVEWNWFARGGQVAIDKGTFDYKYSGSDNVDEVAWYDKISNAETQNVGTKKPNQLELYDCSGNISEWCFDMDKSTKKNNKTVYRIIKGVSWFSEASWCSVLPRFCYNSIYSSKEIGFRIVRTV